MEFVKETESKYNVKLTYEESIKVDNLLRSISPNTYDKLFITNSIKNEIYVRMVTDEYIKRNLPLNKMGYIIIDILLSSDEKIRMSLTITSFSENEEKIVAGVINKF